MLFTILSEVNDPAELAQSVSDTTKDASQFLLGIDPALLAFNIIFYIGKVLLTVIGFLILTKVLIFVNHHASKGYLVRVSKQRRETILAMLDNLIKYVMGGIGTFSVLVALGFDKATLLAGAGAISLILGIAAKELITDFINGFFTVVEGYYDVGDYIVVNDHVGVVETLGIKATVIRTDNGELITIPNSLIEEIINYNRGQHHLFLTVSTAYEATIDEVVKVIDGELLDIIVERSNATAAVYLGVACLNSSSVDHRIKVTCQPNDRFQVERDVYTETKRLFDSRNIEIPYTKVMVYNENDGEESSEPKTDTSKKLEVKSDQSGRNNDRSTIDSEEASSDE